VLEHHDKPMLERRVPRVHQPGKTLALPQDLDAEICAELFHARPELAGRHVIKPVVFDARDEFARASEPIRKILLPPSAPLTQRSHRPADAPLHAGNRA
jgi:hypothetical protein